MLVVTSDTYVLLFAVANFVLFWIFFFFLKIWKTPTIPPHNWCMCLTLNCALWQTN